MYCVNCGKYIPDNSVACSYCGAPVQQFDAVEAPAAAQPEKKENMINGIVGALLGAALGAAAIILVSRLGFVAGLCGIILAVCTFKGYELLGGKLSTTGIIICSVLILITPYFADRIDWAILIAQEFDAPFGRAFSAIPELVELEGIESDVYWGNLVKLYIFTLLGAVSNIIAAFKTKK